MPFNGITAEELNQKFIEACSYGDYKSCKTIYDEHYLKPNSFLGKFLSFFKLSKYPVTILDPFYKSNSAFNSACQFGQEKIVEFLLNDKNFLQKMSYNDLMMGFALARDEGNSEVIDKFLKCEHFYNHKEFLNFDLDKSIKLAISDNYTDILESIISFVNPKEKFIDYDEILEGFLEACCRGYLDSVRFCIEKFDIEQFDACDRCELKFYSRYAYSSVKDQGFIGACENDHLNIVKYIVENMDHFQLNTGNELSDLASKVINQGFMFACSNGNLDIVKYFTNKNTSFIHIDVKEGLPYYAVNDNNLEVLRYFIFDLGLEREEFFESIPYAAEELFKIKKNHDELQIELNIDNTKSQSKPNKKLKI